MKNLTSVFIARNVLDCDIHFEWTCIGEIPQASIVRHHRICLAISANLRGIGDSDLSKGDALFVPSVLCILFSGPILLVWDDRYLAILPGNLLQADGKIKYA
jgi:hypothetical protein